MASLRRRIAALSALLAAEAAVRVPAPGAPLQEAPVLASQSGRLSLTLDLGPVDLEGPGLSLSTRAFNASVPGPTLAVSAGDLLSLLFRNSLAEPAGKKAVNSFHDANVTNLHLHGLHISPKQPADDVLGVSLRPGESFQYEYRIPKDHAPGLFWVHPHHHGSAVMQSGAGAASALIVRDPPGFLSEQLASLRERVLLLQAFPQKMLQKAAKLSHDHLFHMDSEGYGPEIWLVNGAPMPVISMRPGEWQRLRLVAAGVSSWLSLDFGACEVALLAKDGIYIDDFPRFVGLVTLPQGGRADLVVRCSAAADQVVSSRKASPGAAKSFIGPVFTLRAEGPAVAAEPLRPWAPAARPRYLANTQLSEPQCSCGTSLGLGGNTRWMQGHLWQGSKSYMHISPTNAVVERSLSGLAKHPYHAHTYPFQLESSPHGGDPYFKAGDWHDTYFNALDGNAVVRFRTADFSGPQVVHCHNPVHSDQGMIAVEMVAEGEGETHCGCDVLALGEEVPILPALGLGFRFDYGSAFVTGAMFLMVLCVCLRSTRGWTDEERADRYRCMA